MSLCPEHAFTEPCPQCSGQTDWVIPIVDSGREVGHITIAAFGEAKVEGDLPGDHFPKSITTERFDWDPQEDLYSPPRELIPVVVRREWQEPRVEAPRQELPPSVPLDAVKSLLLGVDLEAARERGRKLYEEALALEEDAPLLETIERLSEK